jgi:uncharacterized protein
VSLSLGHLVLLVVAGLGLGFTNTIASAGSAVSLPILLGLGLGAEVANGTNRVAVLTGALAAAASFHRAGHVDWRGVARFAPTSIVGALLGAGASELIAPTRLHVFVVGALFVAVGILCLRPKRWLVAERESHPRYGAGQMALIGAISFWGGFIVLDGATYMLFALVISVGYDLVRANAMKSVLLVVIAGASLPILAAKGSVEWGPGAILSLGAVVGGVAAAKVAVLPGAATWIYRLLVLVIVGEVANLVLRAAHLH